MNQLTRRHRRFVLLVLAATAWLMPGIAGAVAPPADKLQVLVNDTAVQLQLAYRQHPDERARRQEQLMTAVAAWRAAARSEANNERLATWLRAAIVSSMPGSQEPLPAVPSFAAIVKAEPQSATHEAIAEPQAAEKATEKKVPVETVAKPDDPFRDDPVRDGE
jgi:nucleoside phosphorylase